MPFLPNPWVLLGLGVAFLVAVSGAFWEGTHYEDLKYKASLAKQQNEASTMLIDSQKQVGALELKNANLNAELEKEHADAEVIINQKDQDLKSVTAKLAAAFDSLRMHRYGPGSGQGGGSSSPGTSGNPAVSSGDGSSGDPLSGPAFDSIRSIATSADRLANSYKECKAWALNVKSSFDAYLAQHQSQPAK